MPGTTRQIHSSLSNSGVLEHPDLTTEAIALWYHLNICEESEMCGFFHVKVSSLVGLLRLENHARLMEAFALLESIGAIVYDTSFVWIPGYFESQTSLRWMGSIPNILMQRKIFSGNREKNRAYLAFLDHFKEVFEKHQAGEKIPNPSGRKAKAKPDAELSSVAAAAEAQTTMAGGAPTLAAVRAIFDNFEIEGKKDPHPVTQSVKAFEWWQKRGWTDDWETKIQNWIIGNLEKSAQDAGGDRSGGEDESGRYIEVPGFGKVDTWK